MSPPNHRLLEGAEERGPSHLNSVLLCLPLAKPFGKHEGKRVQSLQSLEVSLRAVLGSTGSISSQIHAQWHDTELKLTRMRVITPQKSANTTNHSNFPPIVLVLITYQHSLSVSKAQRRVEKHWKCMCKGKLKLPSITVVLYSIVWINLHLCIHCPNEAAALP